MSGELLSSELFFSDGILFGRLFFPGEILSGELLSCELQRRRGVYMRRFPQLGLPWSTVW